VDVLAITDLLVCLSGGRPTASAFTAASPLALSPPPATTPEAAPDAPEDTTEAERQQQVEEEEKEQERVEEAAAAAKAKEESDAAAAWRTTHAFPTPRTTPSRCSRRLLEKALKTRKAHRNAHDFDGAFIRNMVARGHNAISPRLLTPTCTHLHPPMPAHARIAHTAAPGRLGRHHVGKWG